MNDKQVKKVLSEVALSLNQWKLHTMEGKIFLNQILERLYPVQATVETNVNFDEEIQTKCLKLSSLLCKMEVICRNFADLVEKAEAVTELANMTSGNKSSLCAPMNRSSVSSGADNSRASEGFCGDMGTNLNISALLKEDDTSMLMNSSLTVTSDLTSSDLVAWITEIRSAYSSQFSMNKCVVEQICHLTSRQEALFHCSVWLMQPAVGQVCLVSEAKCQFLLGK